MIVGTFLISANATSKDNFFFSVLCLLLVIHWVGAATALSKSLLYIQLDEISVFLNEVLILK